MTAECGQCHISIYQEDSVVMDVTFGSISNAQNLQSKKFKAFTVQQNKEWYCATCTICKKCNKIIKGNSLCCDVCNHWYHRKCTKVGKYFGTLTKSNKEWLCPSCLTSIFPFQEIDNNKIHKLFASTETDTQSFETTQDNHMTHLPFSFISKDDLIYLSFNSNNKEYVEPEIIKNIENNLTLNEINIDKCDYFTDIDNNTTLDGNFKYYDVTDFNKMIQPINQKIDFSIMHTNIQSLKCNGEKLKCLLNSIEW